MKNFLLKDTRKAVRQTIVELIEDITGPQTQLLTPESGHSVYGNQEIRPVLFSICTALIEGLPLCLIHQSQPEEYFRALLHLVARASTMTSQALDIDLLAAVARDLLLKHTCIETIDQPDVADPIAAGLVAVLHICVQNSQSLSTSKNFDE
ncbi:hypothetical protein E5D57_002378 [Metarhizium anisopliae]|nr:hypothetical protein E5D57_002378 [Metarhizium anisopliae]